jgi:hypothetical protein
MFIRSAILSRMLYSLLKIFIRYVLEALRQSLLREENSENRCN